MIKEKYIEIVKSRIDICQLASDLIPGIRLVSAGPTRKKCCCVFHSEKTPSLVFDSALNRFKCFGCGKSGDVISFVSEVKGLSFKDAVKYLAGQYCHDVDISDMEEMLSVEEQERQQLREELFRCNEIAYEFYRGQYESDSDEARLCRRYAERTDGNPEGRWPSEYCRTFGLGYSPKSGHALIDHIKGTGLSIEPFVQLGLVVRSEERKGKNYDFYHGRQMIPQRDMYGRILTFTARALDEQSTAKYLNGRDSLIYRKGSSIFGIDVAMRAIRKTGKVYLVEGAPDVMRLQSLGICNVVASLGGAWTREQLSVFRPQQYIVSFIPDMDIPKNGEQFGRGEQFVFANGRIAAGMGFQVLVREIPSEHGQKRDADSWITSNERWESMEEQNFILWYAGKHLSDRSPIDGQTKVVADVCDLVVRIVDEVMQATVTSELKKRFKGIVVWRTALGEARRRMQEQRRSEASQRSDELEGYRFFRSGRHYYDLDPQGREREWTNFVLRPLFLIADDRSPTRIFELENENGVTRTVELRQADVTTLERFKVQIEGRGDFRFFEKQEKYELLKAYLYGRSEEAQRVPQMGWNVVGGKGFYAFCNGIVFEGEWKPVDEYGIVRLGEGNLFLPAMSKIHQGNRTGFVNERRFLHDPGHPVSMKEYFGLICDLYGGNGVIAICFYLATLFRDIIIESTRSFPLLNIYGKKGTGKTEFAITILSMFQRNPEISNLESTTYYAMGEKCAEVSDMMVHFDEYKNTLSLKHLDFLKGIYDNAGRSKRSADGERRESTSVDCGVVITGQEMPTADVALFSRVIFLESQKSERTKEETDRFHHLLGLRSQSPTNITVELVKHREAFRSRWRASWERAISEYKRKVEYNVVGERFINNWAMMLAVFYALEKVVGDSLPFDAKRVRELCFKGIAHQFSLCNSTDEISMFWSMFSKGKLIGDIKDGQDYKIAQVSSLKVTQKSGPARVVDFDTPVQVIYIRERICMAKASIQAKREGKTMLSDESLLSYLTSTAEYIGKTNSPLKFYVYDEQGNPVRRANEKGEMELLYNQERVLVFDYESICNNYDIDLRTFKEKAVNNESKN